MKTLKEQISEIINSKMSRRMKDEALIKIGLRKEDVSRVWFAERMRRLHPEFDIDGLTFGVEIECYNAPVRPLINAVTSRGVGIDYAGYDHRDRTDSFKLVTDSSIHGDQPIECVSPILKGNKGEAQLEKVCDALHSIGARVNISCGLHIHFAASKLTDEHYVNIFKNYQKVEQVIDMFMPVSRRGNNSQWCGSLRSYDFSTCMTKRDVNRTLSFNRYHKVNADAYTRHQTIEFRQHSGTTDYSKIIMWVKFLRDLIKFSAKNVIENDVTTIEALPFGNTEMKTYIANRAAQLN